MDEHEQILQAIEQLKRKIGLCLIMVMARLTAINVIVTLHLAGLLKQIIES